MRGLTALLVLCASAAALPAQETQGSELGPLDDGITALVDETGLASRAGLPDGPFSFQGTLQHVANRFCTEFTSTEASGQVYCDELVLLQHKWIDADTTGDKTEFTKFLGQLTGHHCPDAKASETAKCLVLQLLSKAVPATLKWSSERKIYYQMTKDVASHYCKKLGKMNIFCPLLNALPKHFFRAVMDSDTTKYNDYVVRLQDHFCKGIARHDEDQRCSVLPLLLQSLPEVVDMQTGVDPSRHHTPSGTGGDVPAVDAEIMATVKSHHLGTAAKAGSTRAPIEELKESNGAQESLAHQVMEAVEPNEVA